LIFSLLYGLFAVCLVLPPKEFISSGLTIQHTFASFLGSEELQFIQYHIRLTTISVIIISLLPLGYFVGLGWLTQRYNGFQVPPLWSPLTICTLASILLAFGVLWLAFTWYRNGWKGHPIAKTLALYANGHPWYTVASDLNIEFRRVDKFSSSSTTALRRVIVTDSWVVVITIHHLNIVHQSDIHLSMLSSKEHNLSHLGTTGDVQMLTIRVQTIRKEVPSFNIRLNSLEYIDFKEKLKAPIRNAQSIRIHQTLSDRFVDAFKAQVFENPRYLQLTANAEDEPCIGCMQNAANIKLQKLCNDPGIRDCLNCYCRPMWCIECMGKWFASRQDQSQPDTWLASKSPCPTCRATFCMLDVCLLEPTSTS